MSGTIEITQQIRDTFYSKTRTIASQTNTMAITGDPRSAGVMTVTNAANGELVPLGDVGAANVGYMYLRNLDSVNDIKWGYNDAGTLRVMGRLKAGDPGILIRVEPNVEPRVQAVAGAPQMEYEVYSA